MRLQGQEKLGYYPTPESLLGTIASYLASAEPRSARLLDPCAGGGEALAALGHLLDARETWGSELSPERAAQAATRLTLAHPCAWQACRVGRASISLMLLNPPYDTDTLGHTRLEQQFLDDTAHVLQPGGVLVYIIPQRQLANPSIARHLAARYERMMIVRFPDGEFERFEQIVVFGLRKRQAQTPRADEVDALIQIGRADPQALPVLMPQSAPRYTVPRAPDVDRDGRPVAFRRLSYAPEEIVAAVRTYGVRAASPGWRTTWQGVAKDTAIRPAMPLKRGHIAMLMAAGLMGVMRLTRDGQPVLAKGRVIKDRRVESEQAEIAADGSTLIKTVQRDVFLTSIATLDAHGQIEVVRDQAGLGRFMREFADQLATHVVERNRPLYAMQPSNSEWQAVSRVALDMRLPGRGEGGLLPTQKHLAIAASRVLREHKIGIIAAEMGVGKTLTACGVAEVLNAYPAVVICPPHLVRKWAAEIERGVPGAVARVVNCVERGDEPLADLGEEDAGAGAGDASAAPRYALMDFVREVRAGALGPKAVAVISRERAKLGSGWAPVATPRRIQTTDAAGRPVALRMLSCPTTGERVVLDGDVALGADEAGWAALAQRQRFMPGSTAHALFTQGQGTGDLRNLPERTRSGALVQPEQVTHSEARVGFRRYPLGQLIKRKLRGFFKLCIADEAHQFKAARSDQAIAFHQISRASRYTLCLTGTIFGGKSSSLFHLAHRTTTSVRHAFGVDDERRWAALYGVLETTSYEQASKGQAGAGSEDSALSGYARSRTVTKELPGISPAVVEHLLPQVVFARVADLGYELPAYTENVVRLDMTPEQRAQYWERVYDPRDGSGRLFELMKEGLKSGDTGLLSVWLQTALARPNAGFRDDEVRCRVPVRDLDSGPALDLDVVANRRKLLKKTADYATLMTLETVTSGERDWLPKERWLVDYCRAQALSGRKVLVYCRQTGVRDIQPRLAEALKCAGLRARILRSTVPAESRERWVHEALPGLDVLIVNPKLVETGLDLVALHSVVYAEVEYSLYTLWQSMRRVWRLGQTKPVEVTFLSYNHTLEDIAWSLIGKKLYAAQLLYGDEVGGAIVESDDGDFLTELARSAVDGVTVDDLTRLFADASTVRPATSQPVGPSADYAGDDIGNAADALFAPVAVPEQAAPQRLTLEQMRALARPVLKRRAAPRTTDPVQALLDAPAGPDAQVDDSLGQMTLFG